MSQPSRNPVMFLAACRSVLIGAVDDRATRGLEGEVVADHRGGGLGVDAEGLLLHRVHHEVVAMRLVALRRGRTHEGMAATVVAAHERVARKVGTLGSGAGVE